MHFMASHDSSIKEGTTMTTMVPRDMNKIFAVMDFTFLKIVQHQKKNLRSSDLV